MEHIIKHLFIKYINEISAISQCDEWSDQYCRSELKSLISQFASELNQYINFSKLTKDQAVSLGFTQYELPSKFIYLIPLYLLPIIPVGTELVTINDEVIVYDGNNVNNDTRGGMLAYGIILND